MGHDYDDVRENRLRSRMQSQDKLQRIRQERARQALPPVAEWTDEDERRERALEREEAKR